MWNEFLEIWNALNIFVKWFFVGAIVVALCIFSVFLIKVVFTIILIAFIGFVIWGIVYGLIKLFKTNRR